MGRFRRGASPSAALRALSLSLAAAALLASCGPGPKILRFSADGAEEARILADVIASHPLPEGWAATDSAGSRTRCALELGWQDAGGAPPDAGKSGVTLHRRWLAAPVDFADPRLDAGEEEARKLGLVSIEEIELPRRALAVAGLLPGEKGYPFIQDLVLRLTASSGRLPAELRSWLAALRDRAEGERDSPLILGAVGDMQIGPDEAGRLLEGASGLDALFGTARPHLLGADILVGNLEGPVTMRTEANPRKRFQFRFPPGAVAAFGEAGFDLLLFANNHCFDFGEGGFEDSLADARLAGIPLVGAGMDARSAAIPESLTRETGPSEFKATFIGYAFFPAERLGFSLAESAAAGGCPGVNADEAATLAAIRDAAGKGDFVVVLGHGGNEYRFEPSPEARRLYREFVDAGAKLVIGSHPHVLQGSETYHGGMIAYSLGNFLFTGEKEPEEAFESAMLRILVYRGRIRGIALTPVTVAIGGTDLSASPGLTEAGFMARTAALSSRR